MRIDFEDRNTELKTVKAQNEMLKDKIALLRSEFFKSEAKAKEDNSEIKAKVVKL
jgi:vacuolar-type H+-ATPase subunit D/Vma8